MGSEREALGNGDEYENRGYGRKGKTERRERQRQRGKKKGKEERGEEKEERREEKEETREMRKKTPITLRLSRPRVFHNPEAARCPARDGAAAH